MLWQYHTILCFDGFINKSRGEIRIYRNICGELKSAVILCILKSSNFLKSSDE